VACSPFFYYVSCAGDQRGRGAAKGGEIDPADNQNQYVKGDER
jgi:hypothetical protein